MVTSAKEENRQRKKMTKCGREGGGHNFKQVVGVLVSPHREANV